jgi:serine protease Do
MQIARLESRLSKLVLTMFITFSLLGLSAVRNIPDVYAVTWKYGPPSLADLAEQVKHPVVNISTTSVIKGGQMHPFVGPNSRFKEFFGDDFFKHFFGDMPQGEMKTHALGSGFIIDKDGLILTNNHVIEKADEIKVKIESGKEYAAKVVGRDPKTDLALIKVKPDADFPQPAVLGDSDAIRVGDWVMAVGNPFGLGQTVTAGLISAKGRIIGQGPYDDFLQTDAAINPGNSGGPLFNMNGEVVGINTAIVAQGQGIGFAIPISVAKDILDQLKAGKVIRGWLGVMIQDLTPELAKSLGVSVTKGVVVSDVVKGGPAEKAGLKQGDVITSFNGKSVDSSHALSFLVATTKPNSQVPMQVVRDGKTMDITVTIGTMPEEGAEGPTAKKQSSWGLSVQNITPEIAQRYGLAADELGVVVTSVEPGSPASDVRLRPGDLIKEVNRQKIQNLRDYNQAIEKVKKNEAVLFLVKRGENTFYVVLKTSAE